MHNLSRLLGRLNVGHPWGDDTTTILALIRIADVLEVPLEKTLWTLHLKKFVEQPQEGEDR